jgi:hypothetical protein
MALNRKQQETLMYFLLGLVVLWFIWKYTSRKSGYHNMVMLRPREVSGKVVDESSFFDKEYKMDCIPGVPGSESQFSMGLTPGGICGDQDMIRKQMREYTIEDGIGGDLLEKE